MKKSLIFVSILFMTFLFVPTVNAEVNVGTISDITNRDTLPAGASGSLENETTENVTLTYSTGAFKLLDDGLDEGAEERPAGYAWIGFRATADGSAKSVKINEEAAVNVDASPNYVDEYFGFNADTFKNAIAKDGADAEISYTFVLTWYSEKGGSGEEKKQNVTIIIKPENITLEKEPDAKEDGTVYTEWKKENYTAAVVDYVRAHTSSGSGTLPSDDETEDKETENPNTGDSLLTYLTIGTMAILGSAVCLKKVVNQ